ncbi:MAG: hypothetical protein AB7G75_31570 [Candidatus Binatia bacterium]
MAQVINSLYFQLPLLLLLQATLHHAYFKVCRLPVDAYFSPNIFTHIPSNSPLFVFFVAHSVITILLYKRISWNTIDEKNAARNFVFIICFVIGWYFTTYDFNFYYNQAHLTDRFILVLLTLLVFIHPLFVPPFIMFVLLIAYQLQYPLPEAAWLWPDKKLLIDGIFVFHAFLYLHILLKSNVSLLLFSTLCLTGGIYFYAAIFKLSIGPNWYSWMVDNKLSNLVISSYLSGWLGFLNQESAIRITHIVETFERPLQFYTIITEISGLLILASIRSSRIILMGFVLMHLGILASSGIFFWKWVIFDLALCFFVTAQSQNENVQIYNRKYFALSIVTIVGALFYFRPVYFAWFDSKMSNFFEIYAVTEDGNKYRIEPRFFSPWDIIFTQSRFYYLTDNKILVGTYGSSFNYELTKKLESAHNEDIDHLKEIYGKSFYSSHSQMRFIQFVTEYMKNAEVRREKFIWLNSLSPPYHFRIFENENHFDFQAKIKFIELRQVEYLYTGKEIINVGNETIMKFPLSSSPTQGKTGL